MLPSHVLWKVPPSKSCDWPPVYGSPYVSFTWRFPSAEIATPYRDPAETCGGFAKSAFRAVHAATPEHSPDHCTVVSASTVVVFSGAISSNRTGIGPVVA